MGGLGWGAGADLGAAENTGCWPTEAGGKGKPVWGNGKPGIWGGLDLNEGELGKGFRFIKSAFVGSAAEVFTSS